MNGKRLKFAVPPGSHLLEELEARGIPYEKFRAGIPALGSQADLAAGNIRITDTLAKAIGDALGMPPKIWLNLERNYRDALAEGTHVLSDESLEAAQTKAAGGKLLLRLPATLHSRAAKAAKDEGVSLNQLLLSYIAEGLGRSEAAPH